MFLLKEKILIRGCTEHKQAGLGCGADYKAHYVPLYAPFDTVITKEYYGNEGGNWIWFNDKDGNSIQCAHLYEYKVRVGDYVNEGQVIAITGNTGAITTGPHLHVQIIKNGKRIDPVAYFNNLPETNMVLENLTKEQKKKIEDLLNGVTVLGFEAETGSTYVIRNGKKRKLSVEQCVVNTLFVGATKSDLSTIPNEV